MALRTALLGASLVAALAMLPTTAAACGGCAYPPVPIPLPGLDAGPRLDAPFIVTDHRMVLSLGRDATVLWDQVRYAGRPDDFAWILPVRGEVHVDVASAAFLDEIDALTAPAVASPNFVCNPTTGRVTITAAPPRPMGGALSDELRSSAVDVVSQTVAGPYEVTTVRGDDPTAIHAWLTAHGYRVGDDLGPELAWYTELRMDFVVARLRPGEGVQAIQPLRVRLPAGTTALPLRMIRAGAADRTDLALFVVGEGRQEVTNFSAATVASDDVTWDFATGRSDYPAAFARALRRAGDRAWVTELAGAFSAATTFSAAARDDWGVASAGLTRPWITRLRTSLSRDAMATDLRLGASDGAPVSNVLAAGRWLGEPATPCGVDRRDGGYTYPDGFVLPTFRPPPSGCACRAAPPPPTPSTLAAPLLALAALVARRRRAAR
ncbi:MAG: hypothetical protein JWM10_653 [Myxococcaceae bacterium]|nr:hypothetical protein [Myxococcaceae bacterium]